MKIIVWVIIIAILVILFGSLPLTILGEVFSYLGKFLLKLGKFIDVFGWNGKF